MPPILAWNVSPKIGLKGLSITSSSGFTDETKPITASIWIFTSASPTYLKYFGAVLNEAALL